MACSVLSLSDSGTAACRALADSGPDPGAASDAGTAAAIFFVFVVVAAAESGSAQAASNAIVAKILTGLAPLLADHVPAAAGSAACRWKFLSSALPFQKSRWRARRRKPAQNPTPRRSSR